MIKTTVLAIFALALPYGVKAETVNVEGYDNYRVSCSEAEACNNFKVTYQEAEDEIAQIPRRTRTRRTRDGNRLFEDYYVGASAGVSLGGSLSVQDTTEVFSEEDVDLDLGFQGSIFGGTRYNEYIAADLEFSFGFAGVEDIENPLGEDIEIDETVTILGIFLNPRFEYQFDNTQITAFVSPGIGVGFIDAFDDSTTEFAFQVKAGASYSVNENLDAFAQGKYQNIDEYDAFGVEGGLIYNISN